MTLSHEKIKKMTHTSIFFGKFWSVTAWSQTTFWPSAIFCLQHIFSIFFILFSVSSFSKLSGFWMLIGQSVCASQNWFSKLSRIHMNGRRKKVFETYRIGKHSTFRDEYGLGDMLWQSTCWIYYINENRTK